jgi:glycosyltransferase involved in cell wall biosynthesis
MTVPVWVVVPSRRPGFARRIFENARCQDGVAPRLVVVENGDAHGEFRKTLLQAHAVILTADESPAAARNVGVQHAITNGGGLIAFMDDDDIYGPDHLLALYRAWRLGRVVGKADHFVRTRDDRLYLLEGFGINQEVSELRPQTVLFHSDDAVLWRLRDVEQEDPDWCAALREAGKKLYAVTPHHFCFWNHPHGHVWAPPDTEWALRVPQVWDLGTYDEQVVFNRKKRPDAVAVKPTFEALEEMFARAHKG